MASPGGPSGTAAAARGRCRCGHLATNHMVVRALAGTASFRLEASGPCQLCGAAVCRQFSGAPD